MSVALVITSGYGNGTLTGNITSVVTRAYSIGAAGALWTPTVVDGTFAWSAAAVDNTYVWVAIPLDP